MENWLFALLLKPIAAMAIAFAYYFTIIRFVSWLLRTYSHNRLVVFLCRERGRYVPTSAVAAEVSSVRLLR